MPHVTHKNPDGKYVHFCTECAFALLGYEHARHVVFRCKCKHVQTTKFPTLTVGPRDKPKPVRIRFTAPKPKCAYLAGPLGDPVKLTCGNQRAQPQECACPSRSHKLSRDGNVLPTLAADGWWCSDLGKAYNDTKPRVLQLCQRCPYYLPQKLLTYLDQPARVGSSPKPTAQNAPRIELPAPPDQWGIPATDASTGLLEARPAKMLR
jgi:hypothetical protein